MAFEFDADGFLTERRGLLQSGIRDAYKQLFARAYQINRDCHGLLFAANIHNRDGREVLVATLFIRALEHYQASILLLGTGLVAQHRLQSAPRLKPSLRRGPSHVTRRPSAPSSTTIFFSGES
jgi:hypothetical protein